MRRRLSQESQSVGGEHPVMGCSAPARRAVAALMGCLYFTVGCYTYTPPATAPTPGEYVAFDLTDAGRAAVADRMGPGVVRVEGRMVQETSDEYTVAVSRIAHIDSHALWSGEQVRLRREYVARTEERKLSKVRTFVLVGVLVAGLVTVAVTTNLAGLGGGGDVTRQGDCPGGCVPGSFRGVPPPPR